MPLDIATDLPEYMAERRQCLHATMDKVAIKARNHEVVDVSIARKTAAKPITIHSDSVFGFSQCKHACKVTPQQQQIETAIRTMTTGSWLALRSV